MEMFIATYTEKFDNDPISCKVIGVHTTIDEAIECTLKYLVVDKEMFFSYMHDDIEANEHIENPTTLEDKLNNDLLEWHNSLEEKFTNYELFIENIMPILLRHIRTTKQLREYCKEHDDDFGYYWNINIQKIKTK